jgi:SAM-dependent methyltransferase
MLENAKKLHQKYGFNNVSYIGNSNVSELSAKIGKEVADIIICRDVMEHVAEPYNILKSMYEVLKPGGINYIGFSPLYKSPYGSHFSYTANCRWAHLIFSEKTVLNVFKKLYKLPQTINNYQDIPGSGLNKLSFFEYLDYLGSFGWHLDIQLKNVFPKRRYLSKLLNSCVSLPIRVLKELFIVNSYLKIIKNEPRVLENTGFQVQ